MNFPWENFSLANKDKDWKELIKKLKEAFWPLSQTLQISCDATFFLLPYSQASQCEEDREDSADTVPGGD